MSYIATFLIPTLALIATTQVAFACTYVNPVTYGGVTTIPEFLLALVDLIFLIAVPIIVIFIIYSGFLFVTAGDNESQITKARFVFMWTIIGALVLLGAKALSKAIETTILQLL